jgi:hypothetical protein
MKRKLDGHYRTDGLASVWVGTFPDEAWGKYRGGGAARRVLERPLGAARADAAERPFARAVVEAAHGVTQGGEEATLTPAFFVAAR